MMRAALDAISLWAMPVLLVAIPLVGIIRGVKVYDVFIEGAKEGFNVAIRIIPFLVGILVAIGMFRGSGAMDLLTAALRPIVAPNGGRVVLARPLYYTGTTVVIDHGVGLVSLFAHLSKLSVGEGDIIDQGGVIGEVGATGRVTGPHLHWTLRAGGARVDPLSLLAVLGRE